MYKLVVSELAHEDLEDIVGYIAVDLANPLAAANLLNEVEKCYSYLKNNPFLYERCNDAHLGEKNYRKATFKNYVLVYKVDEPNRLVIVSK
ncbi:type II toxin-antitoxin system RelE/ParE family toxin [Dehalobacterium formicoaceticum]|uniref:Type II toxin-antitoxin system RelE/ParE family toxin n=1 Tax=Dehalobacterium formicoaceticum TaxID=51515 RepID=A0ABT1Y5K8_9FIRM|nr:type II toxin-antitoxin system RelE/ParE family toxin [Dehalobacterium formicoaceticum]MCR6544976.1 type II toxin-antitoxin system RelE/ParE family toxin [Dehalobacterium formicoaceticum]